MLSNNALVVPNNNEKHITKDEGPAVIASKSFTPARLKERDDGKHVS